jgi:hypothetical protein
MPIRHRVGRRTRLLDVPVCPECLAALQQQSAAEERTIRLSWLLTGAAALLGMLLGWFLLPASLLVGLHLAAALGLGVALGTTVWTWSRRDLTAKARPEKQDVLASARIVHFSWRAATFEFANESYAEAFTALNKDRLMPL